MRSKSVLFLFVLFVLFPEKGFAHYPGQPVPPCTGVPSLAIKAGLSKASTRSLRMFPDLGAGLYFCGVRQAAADNAPSWVGLEFTYGESIHRNLAMRNYMISVPWVFPIRTGTDFGLVFQTTLSSPTTGGGVTNVAMQGGFLARVRPWYIPVVDLNPFAGGFFGEMRFLYGTERSDVWSEMYGVAGYVGYLFGGN